MTSHGSPFRGAPRAAAHLCGLASHGSPFRGAPRAAAHLCGLASLVISLLLATDADAATKRVVAVMYFDNNTTNPEFDPLRKGLADMLITDLSGAPNLTLVEREKLQTLVAELDLQKTAFFDPATALKMGKGVGATHAVTGSIAAIDPAVRIDIRLLEIATGKVVVTEQVKGQKDKFFELEEELAKRFLKALQEADAGRTTSGAQDVASMVAYGKAIDSADKGDFKAASTQLSKVVSSAPAFSLAKDRYQQILKRLYGAAEKRDTVLTDTTAVLLKNADAYLAGKDIAKLEGYDDSYYFGYRLLKMSLGSRQLDALLKTELPDNRWAVTPMSPAMQSKALPLMRAWADNALVLNSEITRWQKEGEGKRMQFVPTSLPREDDARRKSLPGDVDDLIFCFGCPEQLPIDIARWTVLGSANRAVVSVNPSLARLDPAYAKKAIELLDWQLKKVEGTKVENWIALALFTKGECLLALRRQEEAIAHWQQLLDRFPTNHLFKEAEAMIKMTLGVSEKQVAFDAAIASCTNVSGTYSGAANELVKVGGLQALDPKLDALAASCARKGQAGANEEGVALMQAAASAGAARECALYEKWKARTAQVMPSFVSSIKPGACPP